ncbi:helix-turn-helix domain-containing protein [Natronolimnohabitans innermongolicus]|uniref:Bacterio-opsin activator HTH domain-containing protein n=1 Tax=Natronolimnohabitans innermongolicus JCM 12255 TaxID=1227499 RepID=L9X6F4_9EURY|nr:bacterio-opsin activator domain-containing protein [Natronolimnohabitans innermongolicus]ELY57001.1 bacterio-opsin activator HTH domain-containing protein [Natronolimnohabitans innermongolicus JCM 12255]
MTAPTDTAAEPSVVEVEFVVTNEAYPLVALSSETGCTAELVQILPRSEDTYTVFHRISGASPERIADFARSYDGVEARVVSDGAESAVVEFRISGDGKFFTICLTDAGAIPTQLASEDGVARIVAEIPAAYSASEVIERFQDEYPTMEIIARRQKEYPGPLFQRRDLSDAVETLLTPRQREVLLFAYANGYYDWPRGKTGEELAAELDVTHATFSEHLRKAEAKVLSMVFGAESESTVQ